MERENLGVDLFGNPVLPRREGAGRPAVQWDQIVSNRVLLAFVRGWGVAKTAKHVGLSTPTLRKVYFSECEMRTTASERMEMRQLERLNGQADAGNVAAEKELARRIEQLRMRDASSRFGEKEAMAATKAKAKPKLGKKDQAREDAKVAGVGSTNWGDLIGSEAAH